MGIRDMDSPAIASFLAGQRTGVLSLAREHRSYGVPISFVYDEEGPRFFFRLAYGSSSQKREFLDATTVASFVVYDETDDGWKSVVARGPLEEEAGSNIDTAVVETIRKLDIPYFSVHEKPASELEFTIVRMDVRELRGIVESPHFE